MSKEERPQSQPSKAGFLQVGLLLAAFTAVLVAIVQRTPPEQRPAEALIPPILAMIGLTGVVWLLMVIVRNVAVLRGVVSAEYFVAYTSKIPEEWLERPARTFNNLMQVPTLFYVVCLLTMITSSLDRTQLILAWIFVGARCLHAVVYIVFNIVLYRFACWMTGLVTLVFLWTRFAMLVA